MIGGPISGIQLNKKKNPVGRRLSARRLALLTALLAVILFVCSCARTDAAEAYERGAAALEEGRYDAAERAFSEMIEAGQYRMEAYRGIGLSHLARGQYADACISFERSLLYTEDQSFELIRDVNLYLAYSRTMHGENDKAIEIYTNLLKKETDPEVLYLRGRLYMKKGLEDLADDDFRRAAELSTDYDLFINIYQVYKGLQKDADGSAYLEKALEMTNQREGEDYEKGLVNYYLQNYEIARDHLIRATQSDPSNKGALLLLGRVYLSMDDAADARALFREHIEDPETAAVAYNGLALCDMAEENYEEALKNVQKGLDLHDSTADQSLRFNEIVICEMLRDWKSARTKAASYVTYYPNDELGLREN